MLRHLLFTGVLFLVFNTISIGLSVNILSDYDLKDFYKGIHSALSLKVTKK